MSDTIITSTLDGNVLVIETRDGPITYDSKFLVAALLIFVARGSGQIAPEESAKMIELIEDYFKLQGAESLELLTRAISEMAERPMLGASLAELGRSLSDQEKEDIALMALKVIAADGRREVAEMEQFNAAVEAADISPEIVHRAFDRYFSETMSGTDEQ
ncbi:MAG: TerB family tellurite resistance protein [Woeseiaceae bacterium]|nr:TerB family tellurite resistance protein [Woeseiaceae bacterium]